MTTVVYDGYDIASDSLIAGFHAMQCPCKKIFSSEDGSQRIAIAGNGWNSALKSVDWILSGADPDNKPIFPENCDFDLLWVSAGFVRMAQRELDFIELSIDAPFGIGSGSTYALGALKAGASIEEAIKIASQFDIYTDDRAVVKSVRARPTYPSITTTFSGKIDLPDNLPMGYTWREKTSTSIL